MPCLNETGTLAVCIGKAQGFLTQSGISGEVVIADNGSTDGSQAIAENLGARVVSIPVTGYGALSPTATMRFAIPSAPCILLAVSTTSMAFFLNSLRLVHGRLT